MLVTNSYDCDLLRAEVLGFFRNGCMKVERETGMLDLHGETKDSNASVIALSSDAFCEVAEL